MFCSEGSVPVATLADLWTDREMSLRYFTSSEDETVVAIFWFSQPQVSLRWYTCSTVQEIKYQILLFFYFSNSFIEWVGLPCWIIGKESPWQAGDMGLIPGSGRYPEAGNGNPLQYSCWKNSMNRGAWCAAVHGVSNKSDIATKEQHWVIRI